MSLIPFLSSNRAWKEGRLPVPWKPDRVSIYDFICENIDPKSGKILETCSDLPDEEIVASGQVLRFAPGALEGMFGHHSEIDEDAKKIEEIHEQLRLLLKKPTLENMSALYDSLSTDSALSYIDTLMQRILDDNSLNMERLYWLSCWLLINAPDRGPVKMAMTILGVFQDETANEIFLLLGRHDEFTLYAVVALGNSIEDSDQVIWDLAQRVDGWGRIHCVERLAETDDPEIKRWMVREGFRNSIMDEYLAHICATTGDLTSELKASDPDKELLDGAGSIIRALISGGPAQDIRQYEHGAEVIESYLSQIENRISSLDEFLVVSCIQDFLSNIEENWDQSLGDWNVNRRNVMLQTVNNILTRNEWTGRTQQALQASEGEAFWLGMNAAKVLGIDAWDIIFQRQKNEPEAAYWYELMQTEDPNRVEDLVVYAENFLPLDEIATGPSDELGIGPEYEPHSALDFIVQELGRFPGKGWNLIKTALRSPVERNRHMAINALGAWGEGAWPDVCRSFLEAALEAETEEDVKGRIAALLKGELAEYDAAQTDFDIWDEGQNGSN